MRVFQLSLLIFFHVLCLPLHGASTALSGGSSGLVSIHRDEAAEHPNEISKANSLLSFPTLPHVFESIQNAYIPSVIRMTGIIQAFVAPPPPSSDFWEKAKEYEGTLQEYIPRLLKSATLFFDSISAHITQATSAMDHIINATSTFRESIQDALNNHNITLDMLTEEFEHAFTMIVDDLKKMPSPEKASGHVGRAEQVDKVLDDTTLVLKNTCMRYGIEEEVIDTYLSVLRQHVHALIVAVGDINEQYPGLLPAILFCVAGLLVPESWLLRPFLSVFGFGPSGPIKGSAAAWMQKHFWGAAVASGSWFSWLQAAGMGIIPKWSFIMRLPWVIGAFLAALLPCFFRG